LLIDNSIYLTIIEEPNKKKTLLKEISCHDMAEDIPIKEEFDTFISIVAFGLLLVIGFFIIYSFITESYLNMIKYLALICFFIGLLGWVFYFNSKKINKIPLCPSCKKIIGKNWIFCPYCGCALEKNKHKIPLYHSKSRLDEDYIEDRISREEYLKKKKDGKKINTQKRKNTG